MFGWLCVSSHIYIINRHNVLFFSLLCITTPLHVSGPFVAHHEEAECEVWRMVLVLLPSWLSVGLGLLRSKTGTIYHTIHSVSWWWATNGPETFRGVIRQWSEKNSASYWFIIQILYMLDWLIYSCSCYLQQAPYRAVRYRGHIDKNIVQLK
jgi:hypothetical protein